MLILIYVGLLRYARVFRAIALVEINWRLVPQEGATFALLLFQLWIFLLEFLDELGDFGLVLRELLAEYHGLFDNKRRSAHILPRFVPDLAHEMRSGLHSLCGEAIEPKGMAGRAAQQCGLRRTEGAGQSVANSIIPSIGSENIFRIYIPIARKRECLTLDPFAHDGGCRFQGICVRVFQFRCYFESVRRIQIEQARLV